MVSAWNNSGAADVFKRIQGFLSTYNTLRSSGDSASEAFGKTLRKIFDEKTARRIEMIAGAVKQVVQVLALFAASGLLASITTAFFGLVAAMTAVTMTPLGAAIALITIALIDLFSGNSKLLGAWRATVSFIENQVFPWFKKLGDYFEFGLQVAIMSVLAPIYAVIDALADAWGWVRKITGYSKKNEKGPREGSIAADTSGGTFGSAIATGELVTATRSANGVMGSAIAYARTREDIRAGNSVNNNQQVTVNVQADAVPAVAEKFAGRVGAEMIGDSISRAASGVE
ncbi:MAG: hypothetical protein AAF385_16055 [Pseudomonadota bacterium]